MTSTWPFALLFTYILELDLSSLIASRVSPSTFMSATFFPAVVSTTLIIDRKSTRLNSSHLGISYAVFCLKKKKKKTHSSTTTSQYSDNRSYDASELAHTHHSLQ